MDPERRPGGDVSETAYLSKSWSVGCAERQTEEGLGDVQLADCRAWAVVWGLSLRPAGNGRKEAERLIARVVYAYT